MPASQMQTLLNRYCKNILGVKLATSNLAVASELGQFSLNVYRKVAMVKYWWNIVSGSHARLRYVAYAFLRIIVNENLYITGYHRNWAREVRDILYSIGFMGIWNNEFISVSKEVFVAKVKSALVDLYIHDWYVAISQQDKCYMFRLYKTVFQHELYLSICIGKYRTALTRLRLSSHSLGIELGRYPPRIPRDQRICLYCNVNDIDDEFHFVLKCTLHDELRTRYIPRTYRIRPNMVKFIDLLACDDNINTVKLAKYTYFAFIQRSNLNR
jgi:hypothetical protein